VRLNGKSAIKEKIANEIGVRLSFGKRSFYTDASLAIYSDSLCGTP